jgi:NitT/TauT family transport system substrate-binding protein
MTRLGKRSLTKAVLLTMAIASTVLVGIPRSLAAEASSPTMGDGGKVRLLYYATGTNAFQPPVIQKFGLDKKYGFEIVPVQTANPQTMTTAIQTGGGDIGMFGWNDIARMRNAGVKIIGIAPFLAFGVDFIVLPINSPIKTFADLKGKRVGAPSLTSINTIAMRALAKNKYNFDLLTDSNMQAGSPTLLWGLLDQGQLDASEIFNSLTPAMLATGKYRSLMNIKSVIDQLGLPDTPYLLYGANTDFVAAHPGDIRAFVAANSDAVDILDKDDSVWVEPAQAFNMTGAALASFRAEARADMRTKFTPHTEDDIRATFNLLLQTAGPDIMGMNTLPSGFMTLEYQ